MEARVHLIDSHAHLNDEAFANDLPQVVARAEKAGVGTIINVGYDLQSSKRAIELAEEYSGLWAVVGVHPHNAKTWAPEIRQKLETLARHPKVVAIGEAGLDYHYDNSPREVQREVFREQLTLGRQLGLGVVIHSREAAQETLEIMQEFPDVPCLLHCYSGSWEMSEVYKEMDHYFSFAGPITFKNARRLREVVKRISLERVLLETDCPYLTPHPHRGKRNEPSYLPLTAGMLAEIHGIDIGEIATITRENTRRFFPKVKEEKR